MHLRFYTHIHDNWHFIFIIMYIFEEIYLYSYIYYTSMHILAFMDMNLYLLDTCKYCVHVCNIPKN